MVEIVGGEWSRVRVHQSSSTSQRLESRARLLRPHRSILVYPIALVAASHLPEYNVQFTNLITSTFIMYMVCSVLPREPTRY